MINLKEKDIEEKPHNQKVIVAFLYSTNLVSINGGCGQKHLPTRGRNNRDKEDSNI